MRRSSPIIALLAVLYLAGPGLTGPAMAQALTVSVHTGAIPSELSESIVQALTPGGLRAALPQGTIEFWWVASVPSGDGASGATGPWRSVAEGTLIGAMRVTAPIRDIRGRTLNAGVYTLRYALQPVNGDHLGVSPFREFLLASPAAVDRRAEATGYHEAVNLSRQAIGSSHPAVLSIDPPVATAGVGTVTTNEAGHTMVVVEVPVSGGGVLRFGLVLVGRIDA